MGSPGQVSVRTEVVCRSGQSGSGVGPDGSGVSESAPPGCLCGSPAVLLAGELRLGCGADCLTAE